MKTYTVHAQRVDGWWGLTVPEVPGAVSQVRSLASAEEYVREAIAFVAGVDPDSFTVQVVPQLPGALGEEVAQARSAAVQAEQAQVAASALTRDVVAKLAEAGYNGRETAVILGVSKQRVSQLAGEPHGRAKSGSSGGRITAKNSRGGGRITAAGSASSAPRAASRGTVQG